MVTIDEPRNLIPTAIPGSIEVVISIHGILIGIGKVWEENITLQV